MRSLAIDLGSANIRAFVPDKGIVLDEPTIVAMRERTGEVLAMGHRAWREVDAAPGEVVPVRPLRSGAVSDFTVTEALLRLVLGRLGGRRFGGPRVLICVPTLLTPVERRAVREAAESAGARGVELIAGPMAAAIGGGLPVDEPTGSFIVDVGAGVTEAAVISMSGVVSSRAERVGGSDLDDAVRSFLREEYGLAIGERTAEMLKVEAGSAYPTSDEPKAEIRGRDIMTGSPKTIVLDPGELRASLDDTVRAILDAIRATLSTSPPELSHDVLERGMTLTGGGAMLRGMDARIVAETSIPVSMAQAPLSTAVLGAGRALTALDRLKEHGILLA